MCDPAHATNLPCAILFIIAGCTVEDKTTLSRKMTRMDNVIGHDWSMVGLLNIEQYSEIAIARQWKDWWQTMLGSGLSPTLFKTVTSLPSPIHILRTPPHQLRFLRSPPERKGPGTGC